MIAAQTLALPRFGADPSPPVRIPQGRTIGSVTGVAVTPDGHIHHPVTRAPSTTSGRM